MTIDAFLVFLYYVLYTLNGEINYKELMNSSYQAFQLQNTEELFKN